MYRENAWRQFHKNATSYIKQFRKQHPTKQLYGHLPPISKTIQIRRTRHVGHFLSCKNELISYILQWTFSHRRASVGWPAGTYLQQLCTDTGYSLENLPEAMDNRVELRERVREIRGSGTTWWWWWWWSSFGSFLNCP